MRKRLIPNGVSLIEYEFTGQVAAGDIRDIITLLSWNRNYGLMDARSASRKEQMRNNA
jgi:hypothetical protein